MMEKLPMFFCSYRHYASTIAIFLVVLQLTTWVRSVGTIRAIGLPYVIGLGASYSVTERTPAAVLTRSSIRALSGSIDESARRRGNEGSSL